MLLVLLVRSFVIASLGEIVRNHQQFETIFVYLIYRFVLFVVNPFFGK